MPADRAGDGFDVRSLSVTYRDGFVVGAHEHPWGQLVYATSGVMQVSAGNTVWFVPPTRSVWLPPQRQHQIRMQGDVSMRTLYVAPWRTTNLSNEVMAIEVSPLLRELVLHILEIAMLDPHKVEHAHLAAVLIDMIAAAPPGQLHLPLPAERRSRAAAQWFLANPAERHGLQSVAHDVGASLRTLQRHFVQETGISLEAWRTKARLIHALVCLDRGERVTTAGLACGYDNTSAFIAAFKRQFGVTPGRYLAVDA
ncbi:MAG: helix-turn-helix transcriptional regulator [Proteobacteria bacterium]|nr:helix-turn-helix transcriptional regulator [Pseudomonadota bacterium]